MYGIRAIKILYWLALLVAYIYGLGLLASGVAVLLAILFGFKRSGILGILILATSPLLVLIYGLIAKTWLETLIAIARIIEHTRHVAQREAEVQVPLLGYCVRCREKREIQDAELTTTKDGRPALRGTCPECGATMFQFTGAAAAGESD